VPRRSDTGEKPWSAAFPELVVGGATGLNHRGNPFPDRVGKPGPDSARQHHGEHPKTTGKGGIFIELDLGQVVYQAEKPACRAFPDPKGDGMQAGVPRNFQIQEPLDFLAEFTQHRPSLRSGARPMGSHLIRYYGRYSNKSRGVRKKVAAEASAPSSAEEATHASAATRSSQAWAMLIKREYEVDPLCCPECGGQMQVVSFIEPPQEEVIEEILRHCGLWQSRSPRAPPDVDELVLELDAAYSGNAIDAPNEADESHEVTYVDIDTFLEDF
jgi:hypothetical protein